MTFIKEETDDDFHTNQRKLISRIMFCRNQISNKTKGHEASFILIDSKYSKYLYYKKDSTRFILHDGAEPLIPYLNIYTCSNFGNKVIIGHTPVLDKMESGLYFVSTKDKIKSTVSPYLIDDSMALRISTEYTIVEVGDSVHKNYISFNIKLQ